MRVREMEPSQRPRERLIEFGASALSDAELLGVLLRTGSRGSSAVDHAHDLLRETGGLLRIARMSVRELTMRRGLGPAKAAVLLAAVELGQRILRERLRDGPRLVSPDAAGEFLVSRLARERCEVFGFVSLDARHRFLGVCDLTRGTRNQAPVDPAELFRRALLDDAIGVLAFHNHPSGDPEPSRDDLGLTRRLVDAGRLLGVPVHDHLIIAGSRWVSLRSVRPKLFADGR